MPGYDIRGVLGSGGFARVYLGTQIAVGRDVAIKVDNRVLTSERDRRRFYREVNSAGRLSDHPHVIGLYDAGTLPDGRPYLAMELCPGGSLADRLRAHGRLPPDEVRDIGVRLADALAAAHGIGVLHRDIKPANLLINRYGLVGLADFGLASILTPDVEQSATLESLTPAYAAPEAFAMATPAPTADVYSLGATLYALLSGRPPRFPKTGSPSFAAILWMHSEPVPPLPWVPEPLMSVVLRALESDPAARYADGAALQDALVRVPASRPTAAPSGSLPPPWSPLAERSGSMRSDQTPSGSDYSDSMGSDSLRPDPAYWNPLGSDAMGSGPVRPDPWRVERSAEKVTVRGLVPALAIVAAALVLLAGVAVVAVRWAPWRDRTASADAGRSTTGAVPTTAVGAGDSRNTVAGVDYGVPTTTDDCVAAASGGRCVTIAECWVGMIVTAGNVQITPVACQRAHTWETFAIAPLPADALTWDQGVVAASPTVKKVCSTDVMLKSRRGAFKQIPDERWQVEALPPSQQDFARGARVFRCTAFILHGAGTPGSAFIA